MHLKACPRTHQSTRKTQDTGHCERFGTIWCAALIAISELKVYVKINTKIGHFGDVFLVSYLA